MKIYQAIIDTMIITLIAEDKMAAFELIKEETPEAVFDDNKFRFQFSDEYSEEFEITEIPMESGIIHWESH